MTDPEQTDLQAMTEPQLIAERDRVDGQITEFLRNVSGWRVRVGRVELRAAPGAQQIAKAFVIFHLLLAISGALLTILGGDIWTNLGIAMVVGALFAFGAFIAQVWAAQQARDVWYRDTEERRQHLHSLNERALQIAIELHDRQTGASASGG